MLRKEWVFGKGGLVTSFVVLVNGFPIDFFLASRGFLQGDPLSLPSTIFAGYGGFHLDD